MEKGLGGDHDEPYRFELPANEHAIRAWIYLLARRIRDENDTRPAA